MWWVVVQYAPKIDVLFSEVKSGVLWLLRPLTLTSRQFCLHQKCFRFKYASNGWFKSNLASCSVVRCCNLVNGITIKGEQKKYCAHIRNIRCRMTIKYYVAITFYTPFQHSVLYILHSIFQHRAI